MLNKSLEARVIAEMSKMDDTNLQSDYSSNPELSYIEKVMFLHGEAFIKEAIKNLKKANKINTGTLSSDIAQGSIEMNAGVYSMMVGYPEGSKGSEYYDFVNKGVKGLKGNQNSPYKFRYAGVSPKMVNAISGWLRNNKRASIREDQKKNLSALQKKRKSITKIISDAENKKRLAYNIAKSIKQKGINKTGFFDKAVESAFGESFTNDIAKAAGKEIAIRIKSANEYNSQ